MCVTAFIKVSSANKLLYSLPKSVFRESVNSTEQAITESIAARLSLCRRWKGFFHILEMNGDSYRLKGSRENASASSAPEQAGP